MTYQTVVCDYISTVFLVLVRRVEKSVISSLLVVVVEIYQHKEGTKGMFGCCRLVIRLTASGAMAELRQTTDIT